MFLLARPGSLLARHAPALFALLLLLTPALLLTSAEARSEFRIAQLTDLHIIRAMSGYETRNRLAAVFLRRYPIRGDARFQAPGGQAESLWNRTKKMLVRVLKKQADFYKKSSATGSDHPTKQLDLIVLSGDIIDGRGLVTNSQRKWVHNSFPSQPQRVKEQLCELAATHFKELLRRLLRVLAFFTDYWIFLPGNHDLELTCLDAPQLREMFAALDDELKQEPLALKREAAWEMLAALELKQEAAQEMFAALELQQEEVADFLNANWKTTDSRPGASTWEELTFFKTETLASNRYFNEVVRFPVTRETGPSAAGTEQRAPAASHNFVEVSLLDLDMVVPTDPAETCPPLVNARTGPSDHALRNDYANKTACWYNGRSVNKQELPSCEAHRKLGMVGWRLELEEHPHLLPGASGSEAATAPSKKDVCSAGVVLQTTGNTTLHEETGLPSGAEVDSFLRVPLGHNTDEGAPVVDSSCTGAAPQEQPTLFRLAVVHQPAFSPERAGLENGAWVTQPPGTLQKLTGRDPSMAILPGRVLPRIAALKSFLLRRLFSRDPFPVPYERFELSDAAAPTTDSAAPPTESDSPLLELLAEQKYSLLLLGHLHHHDAALRYKPAAPRRGGADVVQTKEAFLSTDNPERDADVAVYPLFGRASSFYPTVEWEGLARLSFPPGVRMVRVVFGTAGGDEAGGDEGSTGNAAGGFVETYLVSA